MISFADLFAPTAVPRVAVAPFGFDLRNIVLFDSIPPGEKGTRGLDLIEPRPERQCIWVGDDPLVAVNLDLPDSGELCRFEPFHTGFDRLDHARSWILKSHEQSENARAFGSAERNQFETSGGTR